MSTPVTKYVTTRREFAELVREYSAINQQTADEQIDSILGAITIWILGAVQGLPENCEGRLLVSGFGSIRVSVLRRGRRNPQRLAAGLVNPAPVTVRVSYKPCEAIMEEIRRANRQLNGPVSGGIQREASTNPLEPIDGNSAMQTP